MSMAQRYADYLEREAHHAATPAKAEAIRQAANKLRELERENAALRSERDKLLAGRMMFWAADPTEDQLMQDDEESIAEYFVQNMRGDVIEVKVGRAVELEPRMMRIYAPTDDESLPRWEWLP